MRRLFYMGLEPYRARYTLQLQEWNRSVFERRGINYFIVEGETLSNDQAIVTGQVLDAHGRSYFGMSQIMNLVKLMKAGVVTSEDVIYFEDMFQPGIESLPYILDQVDAAHRPRVFVRCLAQAIDPDDFVHVWNMESWMACYEHMVNSFVTGVLATNEEMVAHMKIAGWSAPIYNISGLAFGKNEVRGRVLGPLKPFEDRAFRVGFAARWDQEKQPDFYMDLIERYHSLADSLDYLPWVDFPAVNMKPVVMFSAKELASHNFYWKTNPHQDFSGMKSSLDGIVLWTPLFDMKKEHGFIELIPESHTKGFYNHKETGPTFEICENIDESLFKEIETEKKDIILFSAFTIHRSGRNTSNEIRYAVNFRYDNFDEKTYVERKYPQPFKYTRNECPSIDNKTICEFWKNKSNY